MTKINEWLTARIEESGKSRARIARETGTDIQNIERWASGKYEPSGFFLDVLLNYFGYEICIDGEPYGLDELGRYTEEQKKKSGICRQEVSTKIGEYKNFIQNMVYRCDLVRLSKFEEVVNGYGGKVTIERKKK
jgi:transcriptional regulator with XRE-family HTH domain